MNVCLRLLSAVPQRDKALGVHRDDIISLGWCLPCLSQDRGAPLLCFIPGDQRQRFVVFGRAHLLSTPVCVWVRRQNGLKTCLKEGNVIDVYLGCFKEPLLFFCGRDFWDSTFFFFYISTLRAFLGQHMCM